MGIKFKCSACGGQLNVKQELAGRRGKCPRCQAALRIPLESENAAEPVAGAQDVASPAISSPAPLAQATVAPIPAAPVPSAPMAAASVQAAPVAADPAESTPAHLTPRARTSTPTVPAFPTASAAPDPIGEMPQANWYVQPPGDPKPFGPAPGAMLRDWLREGRVTPDSLLWRQDWPDWKMAAEVFPASFLGLPGPATPLAATPLPAGFQAIPTAMAASAPMAAPGVAMATPMMATPIAVPAAVGGIVPVATALPAPTEPFFGVNPGAPRTIVRRRSNRGAIITMFILVALLIPLTYGVILVVQQEVDNNSKPAAEDSEGAPAKEK